jgi:hypothetical protein
LKRRRKGCTPRKGVRALNDALKKRNYVLVCDTVKKNCSDLYAELEKILRQRYLEGQFEILSLGDYHKLDRPDQDIVFKHLRFVFFHTDTRSSYLIPEAFESGIPIILVRGDDITDEWSSILKKCGVGDNIDRECAKSMIYPVVEVTDIRGAIRWVNDYFHPLFQRAMKRIERRIDRFARGQRQPD